MHICTWKIWEIETKYKKNNLESYKNNIMKHKEIEMKLYKDY